MRSAAKQEVILSGKCRATQSLSVSRPGQVRMGEAVERREERNKIQIKEGDVCDDFFLTG